MYGRNGEEETSLGKTPRNTCSGPTPKDRRTRVGKGKFEGGVRLVMGLKFVVKGSFLLRKPG